jgi:hypothetical protein
MESDEAEKKCIRDKVWTINYQGISELLRRTKDGQLTPSYIPTVRNNKFLIKLWPNGKSNEYATEDEELEVLLNSMQINCYQMEPYQPDKIKAQKVQQYLSSELKKVEPSAELIVLDIAGHLLAGEASGICGSECFAAGLPCYIHEAGPVQATVLEPGNVALYGARLPAEYGSEMYAAAKARFPELLQPLVKAVAQLES